MKHSAMQDLTESAKRIKQCKCLKCEVTALKPPSNPCECVVPTVCCVHADVLLLKLYDLNCLELARVQRRTAIFPNISSLSILSSITHMTRHILAC